MQRKVVNIVKEKKKLKIRVKILVEHKDWERAIESLEKLEKIYKSLGHSFENSSFYWINFPILKNSLSIMLRTKDNL